jgi:hypothetical protein
LSGASDGCRIDHCGSGRDPVVRSLHAICQCSPNERGISVRASISTDFIQVDAVDSGPGFDSPDSAIFAPFYTTKRGPGHRLVDLQAIVDPHGGTILAEALNRAANVCFAPPRVFNFESNVRADRKAAECVCR